MSLRRLDNIIISSPDFTKICRTCMTDAKDIVSLIAITEKFDLKEFENIIEMFSFCASLQMSPDDGLPSQICLACAQKAVTACLFKKQCQDSQNTFVQILNQYTISDEYSQSLHYCIDCDKVFLSINDVKFHDLQQHKQKTKCNPVQSQIKLTDEDQMKKFCGYCNMSFQNKSDLRSHLMDHIEIKPKIVELSTDDSQSKNLDCLNFITLSKCETQSNPDDNAGKNESPKAENLKCPTCNKEFTMRTYLTKHMKRHHFEKQKRLLNKPLVCDHCSERFCKATSLAVHIRTKHTKERIFKCDECEKCYAVKRDLNRHLKTHTDTYRCHICDKVFSFRQTLLHHVRIHNRDDKSVIPCDRCEQRFKDEILLARHIRLTHTGESHRCTVCSKTFTHITKLRVHLKSHNRDDEKRLQCSHCPKRFNFAHHLRNHERTHTGARPYLCSKCGCGFTQSHYLTLHMRQHDDIRPYACGQCDKSFGQRQRLERHLRTHTGEKPFMCNVCGKRFSANTTLKRHLLSHQERDDDDEIDVPDKSDVAGDIINQNNIVGNNKMRNDVVMNKRLDNSCCSVCNERFTNSNKLLAHMKSHASMYICDFCNESFILHSALQRHMKTHAPDVRQYACETCGQKFGRLEHLKCHVRRVHSKDRPHVCGVCKRGFCQSGELNIHMRRHTGEKPYVCVYCDKGFSTSSALKTHVRSHTGEKPYKCAICTKAFATSSSLCHHITTHTAKATNEINNIQEENIDDPEDDMTQSTSSRNNGNYMDAGINNDVDNAKVQECYESLTKNNHIVNENYSHTNNMMDVSKNVDTQSMDSTVIVDKNYLINDEYVCVNDKRRNNDNYDYTQDMTIHIQKSIDDKNYLITTESSVMKNPVNVTGYESSLVGVADNESTANRSDITETASLNDVYCDHDQKRVVSLPLRSSALYSSHGGALVDYHQADLHAVGANVDVQMVNSNDAQGFGS